MKKFLAMILVLCLVLAGCSGTEEEAQESGNGDSSSAAETSSDDEQVEIVFWNVFADDSDTGVFLADAAEKFMADNPDIKVTIVGQGGYDDIVERLEAAAASQSLPTMAIIEETFLGRFYPLTVDLSQYLDPAVVENYQDGLMVSCYYDGVLRAVPFNRSMPNLYVNKTLFDNAGITEIPDTWDEVYTTAAALTDPEQGIYGFGVCWDTDAWIYESILYSFGGEIISEDNKTILLNQDSTAADILTKFQDEADAGVFFNPYIYQDNVWSTIGSAFLDGKVAMFLGSNGVYSMYKGWMADAGYEMEIYPHPGYENGIATGAGNIVMFADATEEERAAAAKFIEYLATDDVAGAYTVLTGYLPTTETCVNQADLAAFIEANPDYVNAINQMQYAHRRPLTSAWKSIYTALTDEIAYCMTYTDTDAAASIATVSEQAQVLLNDATALAAG
ncbi:MAG TPA: extracellular solute-binding protein [Oscillospiraceae bacterium]|nr:extracellular solute-binding protein [Oscillospiraceae bacterium]HXK78049.1 extracellular solute-binding protein [Oscillospiraceae bacterium]